MIDFVEYVVAELKSKRLSKPDAVALVRQFFLRPPVSGEASMMHPLLHRNTSDLSEQCYSSTFTGEEFFLADHQVAASGHADRKVLPGVACLEMARAAIEHAMPDRPPSATLELRNTVWAQPIVVNERTQVSIALLANDNGEVDYEIYSRQGAQEVIHCQGRALWNDRGPEQATLDLDRLKTEMTLGQTEPGSIYPAWTRMGLIYGPSFQTITLLHRGRSQALAQLRLPKGIEESSKDYVLHPSLMDGTLQACIGLIDTMPEGSGQVRLPFALESLRVQSPCTGTMLAWVRYSPGSQAADPVSRVDIDLCDMHGKVCVEMRGFSSRVLNKAAGAEVALNQAANVVDLVSPVGAEGDGAKPSGPVAVVEIDAEGLSDKTQEYLRKQFSGLLKLPSHKIDPDAALELYGIDSMLAMKLTNQLEQTFGSLSKTLFFEYQTIRALTGYFIANYSVQLTALLASAHKGGRDVAPVAGPVPAPAPNKAISSRRFSRGRNAAGAKPESEAIAIIGLSGRYPEAVNLEAYWQNLREGRDCIVEVPKERWDWREYFSEDRTQSGNHYSKWGGFIAGVDEFDPFFFNISPLEAEHIDPQERLFLQHAWMAIEDAGYTRAGLQVPCDQDLPGQVGVYVGLMYSEYQLFGAEAGVRGKRQGVAGSFASVANRVSYILNLHGPSMTLDTMCSSSLSAIHIACQDLKQGRTSLAIAGGVNVSIHPNKYLVLSGGQFISSDGHCQSFGEGGDGYIPGEGVGVVILKRLSEAKRDGDHIYGTIRGSALNHGGKTNGYTVPNPQAQAGAIRRALAESGTDARHISYIEAHGTGTKLGDPIEIAALSNAFQRPETGFCLIGSAKSNIGHCESAAGIAGLTKVLLQMRHRQIVPSLHSTRLNPHIDFEKTPFVVNQELRPWEPPVIDGRRLPRIAGISSFGAGGSNAHMIVEEYEAPEVAATAFEKVVILLSAKTAEQLKEKALDLLDFVRSQQDAIGLVAMAYTLQVGREPMEERLGMVVSSVGQLAEKLQAFVAGDQAIEDVYQGQVKRNQESLTLFNSDADLQRTVDKWIENKKYSKLLELWVRGLEPDWSRMYGQVRPRRVSLPTYPFARERYWIDLTVGGAAGTGTAKVLHPLLHCNTSDLSEQRYSSTFTGEEFFLSDHQVAAGGQASQKVLPGVAYLEMARAAIQQALPRQPETAVLELRNTAWAQPLVIARERQVNIVLLADDNEEIDFEICSGEAEQEIVHCQGRAVWGHQASPARLDLEQLKAQMTHGQTGPSGIYASCARMGLIYGSAFQGITNIYRGSNQALAQLRLPRSVENSLEDYVLHPSLTDSALQSCIGLIDDGSELLSRPRLPFALDSLRILAPCTQAMFAWVRYAPGSQAEDKVVRMDIDLGDEHGNVCVQMRGLSSRVLTQEIGIGSAQSRGMGSLLAVPAWQPSEAGAGGIEYAEHHIILCGLPAVGAEELESLVPHSHCLSLRAQEEKPVAERYEECALACFERLQTILQDKSHARVLVQIVITGRQEQALLAGLSGLLKTAALENPRIAGQLILVTPETTAEELGRQLQAEKSAGSDTLIRYEQGARQVLRWQEVTAEAVNPPVAFKDHGVYLITGGLGGLGLLFAQEILEQSRHAKVVLTGRSALSAEKQACLDKLPGQAGRLSYRQVNLASVDQVWELIVSIKDEYGRLNGILHSAGMIADNFILKKSRAEFSAVLGPKVMATCNLDQASQDVELDFFVLFSSLAGAVGNPGQADYATANAFMDQFAAYRNGLVAAKQRHGRTRSINWPLWQAGGMGVDQASQELLLQTTGMQPMRTATGMQVFYRSLALPYDQVLVVEGNLAQIRRALPGVSAPAPETPVKLPAEVIEIDSEILAGKAQEFLRREFSELLKLPSQKIDPHAALENYGIDSVLAMKLTNRLEKTFGPLSRTLFFEYQTISALARYFVKTQAAVLREEVGLSHPAPKTKDAGPPAIEKKRTARTAGNRTRFRGPKADRQQDIAIVGLSGRYPQAENLLEFWTNLREGRDCISEIPLERWDYKLHFNADRNMPGKSYSNWGGFIADVDKFDPLFFNISPKEASLIDPQERLFLETAWETIEDAGYTRESISGSRVGVYVGVMWSHYELFGAESLLSGEASLPSSSHASIANRVSYFFDFHGPSIAVDSMCSSSLTAIHLACEELRKGEIDAAIAGGVNVTIHPYKYLSLSQGKFVASDGRCRSFGEGGDGYVPGEGVGAVLLKTLESALSDGDPIYAVIKSSTVNHGGKTNGYTVPNPNAQADLILKALAKAGIDPGTLSYMETHGTGTSLGDPIEIAGLSKAFEGHTQEKQFCPIGSVKSNIGHLESAAGIAALTKVLLQIRYKQLVPSLHAEPVNPNINFKDSPFYVNTGLTEWKHAADRPRRVGVSSFGAGGANAHIILEEHLGPREAVRDSRRPLPEAFVLSARDPQALYRYAEKVVRFLDSAPEISLADMAYTSQVGRTPLSARLVVTASSVDDLKDKLTQWMTSRKNIEITHESTLPEPEAVFYGDLRQGQIAGSLIAGQAGKAFLQDLLANRDLEKLAQLWVLGVEIDWSFMYGDTKPMRISLPTYPFAKEKCWIEQRLPLRVLSPAPAKLTAFERASDKDRTYYRSQWMSKDLAPGKEERSATASILILDTSDGLYRTMVEQLGNAPGSDLIVLVKPGRAFRQVEPNIYVIDPEQEEQFHQLLEALKGKTGIPEVIIHHSPETCDLEDRQQVTQQLNQGVYLLCSLCKALMKDGHQAPLRMMSVFSGHSDAASPLGTAMGGFFKTLTLEKPKYLAKVVEIQNGPLANGKLSLEKKAALIWEEIHDQNRTTEEVLYHAQPRPDAQRPGRFVRQLVEHAPVEKELSALPLRKNGVYLITGGLGGLGLIFSEYLAKKFQSRLVLIGRSAPGARQQEAIGRLKSFGAEIVCLQADVSKPEDMEMAVRTAKERFSQINGVIHSAGVNRDAFILNKTREEMDEVLAPKIYGAINLDLATRDEKLDWFVLFSSVTGVLGNVGQADYAYANHFLDSFAENRENLRKAQTRSGRTLSINWPLWEEGGMSISGEDLALLEKQTGISSLPTLDGLRYWEEFLRSETLQGVALYGVPSRIAAFIARKFGTAAQEIDVATLFARTEAYLKHLVGEELRLAPERIGSSDRLESFGIDSVMINRVNTVLERDLGDLPKTMLYEHETIREVTGFLLQEAGEALKALFGFGEWTADAEVPARDEEEIIQDERPAPRAPRVPRASTADGLEAIAIIGIHGHYPHSADLDEYWENLKQGKDLIDLVPASRWNYEEFYDADPAAASEGKIYCKWGGFLEHHDKFDPRFFNISAEEAIVMDPQERLFLQSVWAAIEDAGYTRDSLKKRFPRARSADVGVFVGVTTNSYHLWAPEERLRGNIAGPASLPWSIANRVSYFFDFNGPSLPIDTACSSALVAVHLACESLRNRQCQVAVAGGVNLYLHPSKYQALCRKRALSIGGKCHSYGAGDDGFVPGEGVGTLILKPLSRAVADRDRIHAVIRASVFDHSGRSNGYSAPNPNSQANLIGRVLERAAIHPDSIGYVEGHGTGTQLGDSIEIGALTHAFRKQTEKKQFCPIGSVKANMGHSESASGIAGLSRIILQMKHRQLAPSIHSDEANPDIEFSESPFYLQHGLSEWKSSPDHPRRALINSFGAGGVNACAVLEEFDNPTLSDDRWKSAPCLFALSAKDEDRLREYADRLLMYLSNRPDTDLAGLCYTLQVGREAMEERLAIVVSEVNELIDRLTDFSAHRPSAHIHRGSSGPRRGARRAPRIEEKSAGAQNLAGLASRWVAGEEADWEGLYSGNRPRRISLPTYPFARERYWISGSPVPEPRTSSVAQLHPLISCNSSTLKEIGFSSSLSSGAFYAVDHKVNGERIFPGAGFLEMACICGNIAGEQRVRKITDVVWMQPLIFREGARTLRTRLRNIGDIVEYVISSLDDENATVVHSEGSLVFENDRAGTADAEDRISIPALKAKCAGPADANVWYEELRKHGIHYGTSFRPIQEIYSNGSFALSKLKIPDHLKGEFGQFMLHPVMIDGALQTAAGLIQGPGPAAPHVPFALDELEILHPVRQTCYAYAEFADSRDQSQTGVRKFNIQLLNESGDVLVRMGNLFVRPLTAVRMVPRSSVETPLALAGDD